MHLWSNKGKGNTDNTVELVLKSAKEMGIKYLVVASTSGSTAKLFIGQDIEVVCVTLPVGWFKPGKDEVIPSMRQMLQENGIKLLITTNLLGGVDRALRNKFQGIYPNDIVASTLKLFGHGIKVCVEISVMALDAGLVPYGEEIIAVGGTDHGADAACVIIPAHANNFFDTIVKAIICMPKEK